MGDDTAHAGQLEPSERASLERTGRLRETRERDLEAATQSRSTRQGAAVDTAVYVSEVIGRPRADAATEAALVAAARSGDARAKERLVEALLPRLLALARRLRRSGVDLADLLQEGYLAVFEALRRFDPQRGTPFWPYAAPWAHGAMHRLAQDHSRAVRLPPRALTDLARLKRAVADLGTDGADVSIAQAARRSGLDLARAQALAAAGRPARSLDEPLNQDEGVTALVDVLPDPAAEAAYDAVVEQASRPELRVLLGALSARERDILGRRHGIGHDPQTLEAIAGDLGVTRERVRQLESRAVAKLRAAARPDVS